MPFSGPTAKDVSDVALVSLGNVLHRCRRFDDAITVLTQALVVNRTTVMAHLGMANVLAAKERWNAAERFYLSTLFFQPGFRPAEAALVVVQCRKMEENDRQKRKKNNKKRKGGREEGTTTTTGREDSNRGTRGGKAASGGERKKQKSEAADKGGRRR